MKAYLVERSVVGENDWMLTGSGFYNPSIKESAEFCAQKWNESASDPYLKNVAETAALRYEYRVREYTSV